MNGAIWKVCLCVFLAFCLTTYVYLAVYRTSQEVVIENLLARFYAREDKDGGGAGDDAVALHDKIVRLRQRLGIGLDSLPTVRFSSTASKQRPESEEETEMRLRQHECLTVGSYVSPDDDYIDCRSYCGVSDGVDYRFYSHSDLLLNGRIGRAGAYCLPTDAAVCNPNTALVLYTKHGWRCMPQTRAFGGEGGNMILVCNGALLDQATGRVWRGHIDPTLTFESIDEKLTSTDEYRFVCPPGSTDEIGNALIPAPFDRLLLLRNSCASAIPHAAAAIKPDFESGRCLCDDDEQAAAEFDERLGLCIPYAAAYDRESMESVLRDPLASGARATPCVETWSTMGSLDGLDLRRVRPCGTDDGDDDATQERYRPAVMRNYAFLFDRPVPSPYAMRQKNP